MEAEGKYLHLAQRLDILAQQQQGRASALGIDLGLGIGRRKIDRSRPTLARLDNSFDARHKRNDRVGDSSEDVVRYLETDIGLER